MKAFIIGSCVSRDAWELGGACDFDISDYVARTSLASSFARPYELPTEFSCKSDWQRRMLEIDCGKNLEGMIRSSDFDIILVDFIDERFELLEKDGSVATSSVAYQGASLGQQAIEQGYQVLPNNDPRRNSMWARGWQDLCRIALETNPHCTIVMNQVQWGYHPSLPAWLTPEKTEEANRILRNFYHIAERISGNNLVSIKYDTSLFTPDDNHKWGMAPFHYTQPFYQHTISKLNEIAIQISSSKIPRSFSKAL